MKGFGALLIVLGLSVFGVWAAQGMHSATRTKKPVEKKFVDDFGDEEVKIVWVETFELGLLDGAAPAGGGAIALGGALLFLARRKEKNAA